MYLQTISDAVRGIFAKPWVERRISGAVEWNGIDRRCETSETAIKTRWGTVHVCGVCGSPEASALTPATLETGGACSDPFGVRKSRTRTKKVPACLSCSGVTHSVTESEFIVLPMMHTAAWEAELAERDLL